MKKKDMITFKDGDQLNPYIHRFLKSIYSIQVNHLFEKFTTELESYFKFLLRFANMSDQFRDS